MKNLSAAESSKKSVTLACLAVCIFTLAFTLLWWNRYLAVTNDGWHFFHAQQIVAGRMPYRDFYLFIPPLHPLRIALEIKLFGNYLIVPQIFGLLERLLLFSVLCVWLCRLFPARYAAFGVMSGVALYLADVSETLSSLHHEAVFWATLAAFCLSTSLRSVRQKTSWCLAAGFFAGLAFAGKQTSGIGVTLAIAAFLLLTEWRDGMRSMMKSLAVYFTGFALPVSAIALWLYSNQALGACVEQIFLRGASSKGSLSSLLIRPITMTFAESYTRRNAFAAVLVVTSAIFLIRRFGRQAQSANSTPNLILILVGALAAIFAGVLLSYSRMPDFGSYFVKATGEAPLYIAVIGTGALFFYYTFLWLKNRLDPEQVQIWLFSFTTFAVIVTLSLSWAVFVSMLVPAMPFLIAFALSRLQGRGVMRVARVVLFAACVAMITLATWYKFVRPYDWAFWLEPNVSEATESSTLAELGGLNLSPMTKERVETIVQLIQQNAAPDEAIFVHPHMPIFYSLAHRRPATFAAVHFIDVAPDYIAREDATILVANAPAVIVDFEFTEEQLRDQEELFRSGNRSGQRDLIETIQRLSADYDLLQSFPLPPQKNVIRVWARR